MEADRLVSAPDGASLARGLAAGAAEKVRLRVPRHTEYLSLLRIAVVHVARRMGFIDDELHKLELAVDEACANAVLHGGPCSDPGDGTGEPEDVIELTIRATRDRLAITVLEPGRPFPFEDRGNFALEDHLASFDPGGLGIFIIKSFMDEAVYRHRPGVGNELTMVKRVPSRD